MSLDNVFNEAVLSGQIDALDIVKVEDLKKRIIPMGKNELDEFLPKFITHISENKHMEPQFLDKLLKEIIEKQIQLGEFDETLRKSKIDEMRNDIFNHMSLSASSKIQKLSDVCSDLPLGTDFIIPSEYRVSKLTGIAKLNYKKPPTEIYPAIILPVQMVKDTSVNGKQVRVALWNNAQNKWEYMPKAILLGDLLKTEKISMLDNIGGVAIGSKYNKGLAEFMVDLLHANKMLDNLTTNELVKECGWTSEKLFFPFTTKDKGEHLLFVDQPIITSVYNASQDLPRGSHNKAFEVLEELKDNDVFGVVLAGCLASPLIPRMKGKLDENIGIDVYGETTSGKTTIETLVVDLLFGLLDETKLQWKGATEAGIWSAVQQLTNLPVVLDDTHQMEEKLCGMPHALINRKRGVKSQQASDGNWNASDTTKEQYCGTLLFNGEVSINSKNPEDSAGIYGRIISINKPPFPEHYTADMVEALKIKVRFNGGHFAEPWIRYIADLNIEEVFNRITEIKSLFKKDASEKLYQRATTKTAILVYCLQEFNKLFAAGINIEKVVDLLQNSIETTTKHNSVADRIMKHIINKVFGAIIGRNFNEKDCILLNYTNQASTKNGLEKYEICFKRTDYLIVHSDVLEEIMRGTEHGKMEAIRGQLVTGKYIKDEKPKPYAYPHLQGQTKAQAQIRGLKFFFADFKHLLSEDDIRVLTTAETKEENEEVPGIPSI